MYKKKNMKGFVMLSPSVVSVEIGVDVVIILPLVCVYLYIYETGSSRKPDKSFWVERGRAVRRN